MDDKDEMFGGEPLQNEVMGGRSRRRSRRRPDDNEFFGGVDGEDLDYGGGGMSSFDEFLKARDMMVGGVKKGAKETDGEVREGYDSFTVARSTAGDIGGRFISKSPYSAAKKAASRLFKGTSASSLTFVLQKTTSGSNKRYYAYNANLTKLKVPSIVCRKTEDGNKIVMNEHGQVVVVNPKNVVVNVAKNFRAPIYNPEYKFDKKNLVDFDYEPYLIKTVTKEIVVKSTDVPVELKEERKAAMKAKKKGVKTAEQKEKEMMKKAAKKEKEMMKKAAKKEKEQKKKEKEMMKKAAKKEKEQKKKEKEMMKKKAAKKTKTEKKPKAAKKSPTKKSPAKKGRKPKVVKGGGMSCSVNSCA
jgi:hypothetical protein